MDDPGPSPSQRPPQQLSTTEYCSEDEDQPREVLNTKGLFLFGDSSANVVSTLPEILSRFPKLDLPILRPDPSPIALRDALFKMSFDRPSGGRGWTLTRYDDGRAVHDMFAPRNVNTVGPFYNRRFCLRRRFAQTPLQLKTMLIYTDGYCQLGPSSGGCAFRFSDYPDGTVAFRLEDTGPYGAHYEPTYSRASFRAVLAALNFQVSI